MEKRNDAPNKEKKTTVKNAKPSRPSSMNRLLSRWRVWIAVDFLTAFASLIALLICYFYVTPFDYYFYIAIGLSAFFLVFTMFLAMLFNLKFRSEKGKSELKAAEIVGNEADKAYEFGQIGLIVVDKDLTIIWANDFLLRRYNNLVDLNIRDVFPGVQGISIENPLVTFESESHFYQVEYLEESHLYLFHDITDYQNIQNDLNKSAPVVGYLAIDNYNDVKAATGGDDVKFADMVHDIRDIIMQFASDTASLMRPIQDDRYLFITDNENYQKIKQTNFGVLDQVRNRFPDSFTISIGIAFGFTTYSKLAQKASEALDVALSRGGDQAVILPFQSPIQYVGGKTDHLPTHNRVKIRTMANSFTTLIQNYDQIIISPHYLADLDALGSALAVYSLARQFNLKAKICWDRKDVEDSTRIAFESQFTKEEIDEITGDMRTIGSLINDKTLYVAVDHNSPKQAIFPSLVSKFTDFAIIDHHRPGDEKSLYPDAKFKFIDSTASSASELLTYFFAYNNFNYKPDARTATFMLSGIALDTRFFKVQTATSTFDAAGIDESYGADVKLVTEFLEEDWEVYRQKIAILNNAETPKPGVVVACASDEDTINPTILAIAGNEAIAVKGNFASFILGRVGAHEVRCSCRSDGTVNVELIAKRLGGGGHMKAAAATFHDISVSEAKRQVISVLNDYLDSAMVNTLSKENQTKEE